MLALLGVCWGLPVRAEEDWLARSRAILNAVENQPRPAWLDTNQVSINARQQAMETLQGSLKPLPAETIAKAQTGGLKRIFVIYASTSLGEAGLLDILEEASGRDDVLVVFRGTKPGQKVQAFIREVHALAGRFDEHQQPHIVIDPNRFRAAGVSVAPTLTLEENGRVLAKVQGVTSTAWLQSRTDQQHNDATKTRDLGTQGPTREIAEVDLIEEMQHRVAQIDWTAKKREALTHFWDRTTFYELPEATETRERFIDPTVTVPRDVVAPDGTVIVRAGQRVNPLDRLPFTQRLVVFDTTRPAQIEFARRLGQEVAPRRVTYLATRLDRESGWEALEKVETVLGATVYLLTPDLRDRFRLEHVPVVIEAKDKAFVVHEFKVDTGIIASQPPRLQRPAGAL